MEASGTALVTGASRGLGRALAIELATRGFDVVAGMRSLDATASVADDGAGLAGSIACSRLDVTDPGTIAIPAGLRVLINNAGVDTDYLPIEYADEAQWRSAFETNLFGCLNMIRRAIPTLRDSGGGVICNVTSAALLFPMPLYAAYRASKAALSALGESLAGEVAQFGIRVLEIQPGPIRTDMLAASAREPEAARYELYRGVARRAHEGRLAIEGATTSAQDAARSIVDSILDDEAPLRRACDGVGRDLQTGRDGASDADWQRSLAAAFAPTRD